MDASDERVFGGDAGSLDALADGGGGCFFSCGILYSVARVEFGQVSVENAAVGEFAPHAEFGVVKSIRFQQHAVSKGQMFARLGSGGFRLGRPASAMCVLLRQFGCGGLGHGFGFGHIYAHTIRKTFHGPTLIHPNAATCRHIRIHEC